MKIWMSVVLSRVISDSLFQINAFLASFPNRQNLQESRLFLAPCSWGLTPDILNITFNLNHILGYTNFLHFIKSVSPTLMKASGIKNVGMVTASLLHCILTRCPSKPDTELFVWKHTSLLNQRHYIGYLVLSQYIQLFK